MRFPSRGFAIGLRPTLLPKYKPFSTSTVSKNVSNNADVPKSKIDEKLYITTPIFYVNAPPHIGHLYSMVLSDARNRWSKLNNIPSFYTTGTDEHGLKIQEAASKAKVDPKQFVDEVSKTFTNLAKIGDIKYDRFIRTTDPDHLKAVEYFWKLLDKNGYIYKGKHSGWYCISDETFYPESQIEKIYDNDNKLIKIISKETGKEVKYEEEDNYFFKLSLFKNDLLKIYKNNKKTNFIIPNSKIDYLINEINEGLNDLSISRPSKRLTWGIQVPNDSSQKIYVWVDALINYLTSIGFPFLESNSSSNLIPRNSFWPPTHLIGKDIIRFHCIHWPALLLAAGIPLPKQIVIHGHWISEGMKMSKSIGNVVNPSEIIKKYDLDIVRFFLTENSQIEKDLDYTEYSIQTTRNNLINKWANLSLRICGPKFNIERSIKRFSNNEFNDENIELILNELNPKSKEFYYLINLKLNNLFKEMNFKIINFEMGNSISLFWEIIELGNSFIQESKPWTFSNKNDKDELIQDFIIFNSIEIIRISTLLIQPFIPNLSKKMFNRIGVLDENTKYLEKFSKIGSDLNYGKGVNRKGDVILERIDYN